MKEITKEWIYDIQLYPYSTFCSGAGKFVCVFFFSHRLYTHWESVLQCNRRHFVNYHADRSASFCTLVLNVGFRPLLAKGNTELG